jgi:hypothetical protein
MDMTDTMDIGRSTLPNDLTLPPRARAILRHLEKGKTISPLEALMVYQIIGSGLAHAIHLIRNAGHDVITHHRRDERGRKYGEYQLNTRLTLS